MEVDEEVQEFLEHYGVRGMHWGIRNGRKPLTKKQRHARNKKVAIGVGVGVGIGVVAAGAILARNRGLKVSSLHISPSTLKRTQSVVDANKSTPVKKIPRISPETKAFIDDFNRKQKLINRAANEDLKKMHTLAEIPIRDRGYLPEWK